MFPLSFKIIRKTKQKQKQQDKEAFHCLQFVLLGTVNRAVTSRLIFQILFHYLPCIRE